MAFFCFWFSSWTNTVEQNYALTRLEGEEATPFPSRKEKSKYSRFSYLLFCSNPSSFENGARAPRDTAFYDCGATPAGATLCNNATQLLFFIFFTGAGWLAWTAFFYPANFSRSRRNNVAKIEDMNEARVRLRYRGLRNRAWHVSPSARLAPKHTRRHESFTKLRVDGDAA